MHRMCTDFDFCQKCLEYDGSDENKKLKQDINKPEELIDLNCLFLEQNIYQNLNNYTRFIQYFVD